MLKISTNFDDLRIDRHIRHLVNGADEKLG